MDRKTFFALAGIIFSIAVILHLLRSVLFWDLVLGESEIPMLVSWIIVLAGGMMAYYSFGFMKKEK